MATWTAVTGGDYHVAGNWDPAGVPTAATDVAFNAPATYNVDVNAEGHARNMNLSAGTVTFRLGLGLNLTRMSVGDDDETTVTFAGPPGENGNSVDLTDSVKIGTKALKFARVTVTDKVGVYPEGDIVIGDVANSRAVLTVTKDAQFEGPGANPSKFIIARGGARPF